MRYEIIQTSNRRKVVKKVRVLVRKDAPALHGGLHVSALSTQDWTGKYPAFDYANNPIPARCRMVSLLNLNRKAVSHYTLVNVSARFSEI
jgi:hypothetical protein